MDDFSNSISPSWRSVGKGMNECGKPMKNRGFLTGFSHDPCSVHSRFIPTATALIYCTKCFSMLILHWIYAHRKAIEYSDID